MSMASFMASCVTGSFHVPSIPRIVCDTHSPNATWVVVHVYLSVTETEDVYGILFFFHTNSMG